MRAAAPGLALAAALAGCAAPPAPVSQDEARPPHRIVNNTPLPHVTLTGIDKFGEYTSLLLKMTWVFDERGRMRLEESAQEPTIGQHTPTDQETACLPHGAAFNQRTTWFPDTGLFLSGVRWVGIAAAGGQPRPLVALSEGDGGTMSVAGPQAREIEYGYVPCVGERRVREGHRTVGYVAPGDWLEVQPTGAKGTLRLQIPPDPMPYVILRFAGRPTQQALVPGRIVLLTLDVARRRLVLQYQATAALRPQVAQATWDVTLPRQILARLEEKDARRQRAVKEYLAACIAPNKPMDPCANPHGAVPEALRD